MVQVLHPIDKKMRPREGKDWPTATQQKLVPSLLSLGQLHQAMKKKEKVFTEYLAEAVGRPQSSEQGPVQRRAGKRGLGPGHIGQVDERDVRDAGPQVSADRLWAPGNIL